MEIFWARKWFISLHVFRNFVNFIRRQMSFKSMNSYVYICLRLPSTTDTPTTCHKNSFTSFCQLFSPKLEALLNIWIRGWPYPVSSCHAFRSCSAAVGSLPVHHFHHIFLFWFPTLMAYFFFLLCVSGNK